MNFLIFIQIVVVALLFGAFVLLGPGLMVVVTSLIEIVLPASRAWRTNILANTIGSAVSGAVVGISLAWQNGQLADLGLVLLATICGAIGGALGGFLLARSARREARNSQTK